MTATIICCLALLYTWFPGASQARVVSTRRTGRCTSDKRSSGVRPNGLPISRCKRAANMCQKTNDLARAAVGCMGMFGAPASVVRTPPACADHTGMVPHQHNGRSSEPRPRESRLHNGRSSEPRPSGITLPRTGAPHHGLPHHAGTTGNPHHRRSYHTLHNVHWHAGVGTTRLPES